jgi:hypothetical protein
LRKRRLPELRAIIVLAMTSVVGVACASAGLTGVGVRQKASELVFGIPPVSEVVAPPNTIPLGTFETKSDADSFSGSPRIPPPPEPPPEACPAAPVGAAPANQAPESIASPPKEGSYQYVFSVSLPKQGTGFTSMETRTVRNVRVTDPAGPNFTFEILQGTVFGASRVEVLSRFSVDQTAPAPRAGPSVTNPPSARGIFLTFLQRTTTQPGKSQTVQTMTPNPPLKYAHLPIRVGFEGAFDTSSVDSANFTTIRHQGEVSRFEPVDACGTMVSSWFIDATQTLTFSNSSGQQTFVTDLNYGIGTQFGGLMILEQIRFPASDPEFVFDSRIGQTEAKPS